MEPVRFTLTMPLDVLFHIMVARTVPEVGSMLVVVLKRLRGNERQIVEQRCHRVPSIPK